MKYGKYVANDNSEMIAVGPLETSIPFDLSITYNNKTMRFTSSYSYATVTQETTLLKFLGDLGFTIIHLEDL